MASPAWSGYLSRHYTKIQGYAPTCIGLYLVVQALSQGWLSSQLGPPHPVASLINLGVWFGLYIEVIRRYRRVSAWHGSRGAKRGGRGVVLWGGTMVLLALVSLTGFGADHALAMSMFVGAAWMLLYRSQVGSVWGHYVLVAPTLVLMGLASIANPGFPGALLTPSDLLGVVGGTVMVFGIVDGRVFEKAIKTRIRKD